MTQVASTYSASAPAQSWFSRAEAWLDDKGKGAWIATMVLGFIFVWPVGLALLFYMIWSKKMFACKHRDFGPRHMKRARFHAAHAAMRPSGNTAFDAYKEETLRRLEEEQDQFESFLERLRAAKDKAEFDQFMDDRAKRAAEARSDDPPETQSETQSEARPAAAPLNMWQAHPGLALPLWRDDNE